MTIYTNIEELIENEAPHGSGINYEYDNFRQSKKRVSFSNYFDLMDEYGNYEGAIPFKVIIDKYLDVKIMFTGLTNHGRYLANKAMLKEYLEDIYANFVQSAIARYSLEEMFK